MKRLCRVLVSFLCALSLAVCAASIVFWVRSYWTGDELSWCLPRFGSSLADDVASVRSGRGGVSFEFDRWAAWELGVWKRTDTGHRPGSITHRPLQPHYPAGPGNGSWSAWGFQAWHAREPVSPTSVGSGVIEAWGLVLPAWAIAAPAAVLPAWRLRRRHLERARRNDPRTLCVKCGYDLAGNLSGVCPECGTAAEGGGSRTAVLE